MATILTITRARTEIFAIVATKDGAVLDLTNKSLVFTAKTSVKFPDSKAVFKKTSSPVAGITITDAMNGKATMQIDPIDTESLPLGDSILYYDCVIVDGTNLYEADSGSIQVAANVTENA